MRLGFLNLRSDKADGLDSSMVDQLVSGFWRGVVACSRDF